MNKKLEELTNLRLKLEILIGEELGRLPSFDDECHCDHRDTIKFIHEGNLFDEIIEYCLDCGGIIV